MNFIAVKLQYAKHIFNMLDSESIQHVGFNMLNSELSWRFVTVLYRIARFLNKAENGRGSPFLVFSIIWPYRLKKMSINE